MKKILIFLLITTTAFAETLAEKPSLGDGTIDDPYQINTLAHLRWVSETDSVRMKHFIQTADIDAEETTEWYGGTGFFPIGDGGKGEGAAPSGRPGEFGGTYNGQGHIINNLYMNYPGGGFVGLFGGLMGNTAKIENLGLENITVIGSDFVGGLVGINFGTIINCSVNGIVNGDKDFGVLIGHNYWVVINSYANGNLIEYKYNADGYQGEINTDWYNETQVEFTINTVEQLAGLAQLVNEQVDNFSGKTINLGADIQINDTTDWKNWNEETKGLNYWYAIGDGNIFKGTFDGKGHVVSGIYIVSPSITGKFGLFGLFGGTLKNLGVIASYIQGKDYVGILAGANGGTITDCYTNSNAVDGTRAGGLVGTNYWWEGQEKISGSIRNCYAIGNVTGLGYIGGLTGEDGGLYIESSYYDSVTSGLPWWSSDYYKGDIRYDIGGRTTAELKQKSTFVDWDFDNIWAIDPDINWGYPHLQTVKEPEDKYFWVYFVMNGFSDIYDSVLIKEGETVILPEAPDGLIFTKWLMSNGKEFDLNTPITQSITLTFLWSEVETPIQKTVNIDNKFGIKFAKNIVNDKAEIFIILPNEEKPIKTKISIYDMTGNIVFTKTTNGNVFWDLRNTAGRFAANGAYLVVAEVKSQNGVNYHYSAKLGINR